MERMCGCVCVLVYVWVFIKKNNINNIGRQGGGGIYLREELSVFSAHVPNTPSSVKLKLLFVELDLRNVKLLMGCLYRPPSATVEYWDLFGENT